MTEIIARRQFTPVYIWLDIGFLLLLAGLLLAKKKYAAVLVGLLGNIRWHRYDWTNETVVIKQSLGAMLPVLVSMLTTLPVVYFLAVAEDANALMGAITLALVAIDLFLDALLRKKAGRWYASL